MFFWFVCSGAATQRSKRNAWYLFAPSARSSAATGPTGAPCPYVHFLNHALNKSVKWCVTTLRNRHQSEQSSSQRPCLKTRRVLPVKQSAYQYIWTFNTRKVDSKGKYGCRWSTLLYETPFREMWDLLESSIRMGLYAQQSQYYIV